MDFAKEYQMAKTLHGKKWAIRAVVADLCCHTTRNALNTASAGSE